MCDAMNDTTVKKTSLTKQDNTDYDEILSVSAELIPIVVELPPTSGSCTTLFDCGTQTEIDEMNELRAKVIHLEDLLRKNEQRKSFVSTTIKSQFSCSKKKFLTDKPCLKNHVPGLRVCNVK
jgi:hypothetical protein